VLDSSHTSNPVKMKILSFIFCLFIATSATAQAQKYTYKFNLETPDISSVRFANNDTIKVNSFHETSGMSYYDGKRLEAFHKNRQIVYSHSNVENDYISIKAAYPSKQNAIVAIVEASCGGSACIPKTYVAYIYNDKLIVDFLNEAYLQINVDITEAKTPKVKAINVRNGAKDKYGDDITGGRELINGKGFIDKNFRKEYLSLVDVHPETFFTQKVYREPLAQKIGYENFRELRSYMGVASNSYIYDGKYIVFNGCMPHACSSFMGALIIDARSGKYWTIWADIERNLIKFGTTDKWNKFISELIIQESNINANVSFENNKFNITEKK
jgi:hypothetical protein